MSTFVTRLGGFLWSIFIFILNNHSKINHAIFTFGFVLLVASMLFGFLTGDPAFVGRARKACKFFEGLAKAGEGLQDLQGLPPAPTATAALVATNTTTTTSRRR